MRAWCLGARFDLRQRGRPETASPVVQRHGRARVALFRFGVAVAFELEEVAEDDFLDTLAPLVVGPFDAPETETYEIRIEAGRAEQVDLQGVICLRELTDDRLLVVAHALAKSVVLAHYEMQVSPILERVEKIASDLQSGLRSAHRAALLGEIGNALLIESRTVGRIQVGEKPDITWDSVELDRLYERLALDLELGERDITLSRKLALTARTSELYLDLLHGRQGLRVEWYIVLLIAVEIGLSLYDLFGIRAP